MVLVEVSYFFRGGGQISDGGAIFPRKYGPGGTNFLGNLARGAKFSGGGKFPVTPVQRRRTGNQKKKSARLGDKTRKELYKHFEEFDLKITAESEANLHVVYVTFDLKNGKFKPHTY